MKTFYINNKKKFIFIKLKIFYKKRSIIFKYAILYIYKKNSFAEKKIPKNYYYKKFVIFWLQIFIKFLYKNYKYSQLIIK